MLLRDSLPLKGLASLQRKENLLVGTLESTCFFFNPITSGRVKACSYAKKTSSREVSKTKEIKRLYAHILFKTGVRGNIIYPFLQFFRMWRHQYLARHMMAISASKTGAIGT